MTARVLTTHEVTLAGVHALTVARQLQRMHRDRSRFLAPAHSSIYANPAWEILLDLYVCSREERSLSISAACIGISCAPATVLRYIGLLERDGLIVRTPDESDRRRWFLKLTTDGARRMEQLLNDFASR